MEGRTRYRRKTKKDSQQDAGTDLWGLGSRKVFVNKTLKAKIVSSENLPGQS